MLYQDGTAKVLSRRAVLGAIDDSRGPRAEECPICFESYGGGGGGGGGAGVGSSSAGEAVVEPAILAACGHVFCAGCISVMRCNEKESGGGSSNTRSGRGAQIACPQCRVRSSALTAPLLRS